MDIEGRIAHNGASLTPAERKVAGVLLADPQAVAYSTVSAVAVAAGTGAASVVRLANKLGFDGFSALQAAARAELSARLRPAATRIREGARSPELDRHLETEVLNLSETLRNVDAGTVAESVKRLSSARGHVYVVSGEASRGVAQQFVHDLGSLRPGVSTIDGNEVAVRRDLTAVTSADVVVSIDLHRYDRWVVDAFHTAVSAGAWGIAVTDSVLSPLAQIAAATLVVHAESVGPFDSHVGTLALLNFLVTGVAGTTRRAAAERLERAEAAWRAGDALIEG